MLWEQEGKTPSFQEQGDYQMDKDLDLSHTASHLSLRKI